MLLNEIIEKVRWLADEYPKEYAPGCYFEGDSPKCIIGCAALDLDLDLRQPKIGNALSISNPIVLNWLGVPEWNWRTNLEELTWLAKVQKFQDEGAPWAEAVRKADAEVERLREITGS